MLFEMKENGTWPYSFNTVNFHKVTSLLLLYHKIGCLSNDVSLRDMIHLLRKYDVAPLRSAVMRCLPQCAVRHTSFAKRTSLGVANIICRRQTSFKKRTFVGRQKCVFCWCGRRDLNSHSYELVSKTSMSANSITPACTIFYHKCGSLSRQNVSDVTVVIQP